MTDEAYLLVRLLYAHTRAPLRTRASNNGESLGEKKLARHEGSDQARAGGRQPHRHRCRPRLTDKDLFRYLDRVEMCKGLMNSRQEDDDDHLVRSKPHCSTCRQSDRRQSLRVPGVSTKLDVDHLSLYVLQASWRGPCSRYRPSDYMNQLSRRINIRILKSNNPVT